MTVTTTRAPKAAEPKATVTSQPVPTVTVTTTAPPPAATQPAALPADTILAKFYGTGPGNTGTFTVPADGNWHLSYEYTNGTSFAGQAENFIVYEYGTDGTLDQSLVNALSAPASPRRCRSTPTSWQAVRHTSRSSPMTRTGSW